MVEDLLDRHGRNPNKTYTIGLHSLTKIKNYNLTDIWQKENPGKNLFTYHHKTQQIHSRIDHIYLLQNQKIKNTLIIPNNLSDHDAITIILKIKKKNKKKQKKTIRSGILETQHFYTTTKIFSKIIQTILDRLANTEKKL